MKQLGLHAEASERQVSLSHLAYVSHLAEYGHEVVATRSVLHLFSCQAEQNADNLRTKLPAVIDSYRSHAHVGPN